MASSGHCSRRKSGRWAGGCSRADSNSSFTCFQLSGVISMVFLQLPIKPGLGQIPFPQHSFGGNMENLRGFINREAAEVAQFDDASLTEVHCLEAREHLIDGQQLVRAVGRDQ